ncbi:MAG TPA: response regulator transcription factor [Stellaceae bacterium]|nr:response regulator transcription factor [Stellaceae bacterium]
MKILIVDDHPIVRAGLRRLLAGEPEYQVQEAASGREALGVFREYQPELVMLDLSMPGIGGLEVIGRLRTENPAVRVLVLSMHREPIYARRALQAGAAGFMSKNAPADRLLEAVGRVAAGHRYIEHEIAQELALANIPAPGVPLHDLSPREFEILRLLGDGSSLHQIADTIGISYKTVANTCGQIKAKLGAPRTADLVRIAIQHGIAQG